MKQSIIIGVILAFVAFIGTLIYLEGHQAVATSPTGSTFSAAKIAAVAFAPATAVSTSTSVLNTDGNDRFIESFETACTGLGTSLTAYTGAGLASLVFTFATSSTAAPVINTNTNATVLTISTTTTNDYNIIGTGTTTPSDLNRLWLAGSYLSIFSNATNTTACTVGVHYLPT